MFDPTARLSAALSDRYRIERELGQGGMATVYLAEDLKHHRRVAIKVLRPELAAVLGADRFLQEIQTTARLQHPHILPLFDSGEADGFLFYVMPYVEGEALRDKLDRETQLGIDEAVKITVEVADALQYAHEQGVIHRDIKPENILLHAGRPMVADFGIALALSAAAVGRMTETGMSLGTPHYMSPEQATAERDLTNRSDIYSLGCVLYEMLAGRPPHLGGSAQQVVLRIISEPVPAVDTLRHNVPPNVAAALGKALEQLPADRFGTAEAFAEALSNPHFSTTASVTVPVGTRSDAGPWRMVSAVLTVLVLVLVGLVLLRPRATAGRLGEIRFTVPLGPDSGVYLGGVHDAVFGRPSSTSIALSPDGALLVYAGWRTGADGKVTSQLYGRPLGRERAKAIQGTDSASAPFFSPDGRWIGFFSGPSLKRVSVAGGDVQIITLDARILGAGPRGASWSHDGAIVYGGAAGLYRVPADGGEPKLVAAAPSGSAIPPAQMRKLAIHPWSGERYEEPQALPGTHVVLFHRMVGYDPDSAGIVALDLDSGARTTLLANAMDPRYVAPDHLLFVRRGTLMDVGFDAGRLRLVGQPRVVVEDVMQASLMPSADYETGAAQVAVSPSGALAWVPGGTYPEVPEVVLKVAPDGRARPLGWSPRSYWAFRVSPGGNRVAYSAGSGYESDVYVRDLARGVTLRLNVGGFSNWDGVWSPDGQSIALSSDRDGRTLNIYRMPADGSGAPVRLAPSDQEQDIASWSSQGVLAYLQEKNSQYDIWALAPDGKPTPVVATEANEMYATFSPDGRWLAYTSDASGRDEVYVRPYPGPGAATLVSGNGGEAPAWSRDGRRLYYLQRQSTPPPIMMVADVVSQHPFRVGRSRRWIDPWPYAVSLLVRNYDVLPDGSFLVTRLQAVAGDVLKDRNAAIRQLHRVGRYRVGTIHVVVNFLDELGGATP